MEQIKKIIKRRYQRLLDARYRHLCSCTVLPDAAAELERLLTLPHPHREQEFVAWSCHLPAERMIHQRQNTQADLLEEEGESKGANLQS